MTEVRTIFHRSEGIPPEGIDEALAIEGYAEFYAGPVHASHLAFTIHRVGLSIVVRDDGNRRVGTFTDATQAVAHGFDRFDRRRSRRARKGRIATTKDSTFDRPAVKYSTPDRFIAALAAGAVVELFDGPLNARHLAFQLKSGRGAIHVVTPQGEILGVFATPFPAAVHGFARLDREADDLRPAQPPPDQHCKQRSRARTPVKT